MAMCDVSGELTSIDLADKDDDVSIPVPLSDRDVFQKDIAQLTVVDVYSIAASVGREFEKLTDAFGGAIFSDVMPKMIRVLEMLEAFAARSENFPSDIVELQATIQKLQVDEKTNTHKHRDDLEMVEEAWRDETKQLLQTVETLQEDNKRLTQLLTEKLEASTESENGSDQQASVLGMLGESVEKQRDELREKNRLLEQQARESEALASQIQRLTNINADLRHKISLMEHQASTLAGKNNEWEVTCREKERQVKELQKRLMEMKAQTNPSEEKEHFTDSVACNTGWPDPLLSNKLIIDLSDPDRPRYTLHELREVLTERNDLKLKCFLQEEELSYYKEPKTQSKIRNEEQWEEIEVREVEDNHADAANNNESHKPESAIRRLFSSIFSRDVKSVPIPHEVQKPRKSHYVRFDLPMMDDKEMGEVRTHKDETSADAQNLENGDESAHDDGEADDDFQTHL